MFANTGLDFNQITLDITMKILIIDDDPAECLLTRLAISDPLPKAEIIEISTVSDYKELLAQDGFDLVITEYRLNWTDGFTVFDEIILRHPQIPVIMLTRFGNETLAVKSIKKGMADYVVKNSRDTLFHSIIQSLKKSSVKSTCQDEDAGILWCEKWDLAISKLTSDFAYSMRVSPEGELFFEWATEPFKRFLDHHGVSNAQPNALGRNFGFTVHPDDIALVNSRFSKLLDGYEDKSEYRLITKQGETLCLSDHALPIRNWVSGKVVRIYGTVQDNTWRRFAEDKLRLMQRALDCSNNGIVITGLADSDYAIIYVNDAFLKMTGYAKDELLGQNCRILQKHERDQPEIENLRIALSRNMDGYAILRNYRKDGSLFWNEVYISPIRDSQNRITHYLGVQNDVTQRCEMGTLLTKSEAKMRAIFEHVFDAIIISDEQGIIENVNPSAERIFGYSSQELIGKNIKILMPETVRHNHDCYLSDYLNKVNDIALFKNREVFGLKKDGTNFPVALGLSEIIMENKRLFVGAIHDLSESKRVEAELRTSEERYRTLFEHSVEAIFVHRTGFQLEQVNQACLKLWRANTPEELLNKPLMKLFHADYHAVIKERIRRATKNHTEEKILRFDGTTADVLVSAIPFVDEKGPLLFVVLIDITERKQAESALRDSRTQYQELSAHLENIRENERARIARELHDELGSFLTVLKMDLSWLYKQLPLKLTACRDKTHNMVQEVNGVIQTVKRIITDLRPSILDHLGLLPAIEWQVDNFRQRTGIDCILTLPDKELLLDANRSTAIFRITQEALTNILLHAKATQVTVTVDLKAPCLLMNISDNGCGMPSGSSNSYGGYGIQGMRERAAYFGGEVTVSSQPGPGTMVSLSIPLNSTDLRKHDD